MAGRKSIKSYSTTIAVEKTVMEIEQILVKSGATNIFKLYDSGVLKGLAFQCIVNEKTLAFKLPMEEEKILHVFKKSGINVNIEQARKTGWRIIKDWIDSQISLIAINTVKFEQVFLPYMYDMETNQTLFEKFEKRDFNLMIEKQEGTKR